MKRILSKLGRWVGVLAGIHALVLSGDAQALDPHCEVTGCGSNTPVLFGTPIIGLNLRGLPNSARVTLHPQLERVLPLPRGVADCPTGVKLGVQEGRLVGRRADGSLGCDGFSMLGMAFGIEVVVKTIPQGEQRILVKVRISEMSQVLTWELLNPTDVPTYRLVWHDLPGDDDRAKLGLDRHLVDGDSICPKRESWMEPWQSIINQKPAVQTQWRAATDHLLIVQGETYEMDGAIELRKVGSGSDWFNIACVGTSIAKMRLLGFDPMRPALSPVPPIPPRDPLSPIRPGPEVPRPVTSRPTDLAASERQATLKMLTARYVPGVTNPSYTAAGMPLAWRHFDNRRRFDGEPAGDTWTSGVVEAYWGANGAICVKHRRTWRRKELLAVKDDVAAIRKAMPELRDVTDAADETRRLALVGDRYLHSAESGSLSEVHATVPECLRPVTNYIWVTYPVEHIAR